MTQTQPFTVYVSGLAEEATENDVRTVFTPLGEILKVDVPLNKETGKNKGMAFVQFTTQEAVDGAVQLSGTEIAGKEVQVQVSKARSGASRGRGGRGRGGHGRGRGRGGRGGASYAPVDADPSESLYLGNLSFSVTEEDVCNLFASNGAQVVELNLLKNNQTQKLKGYGFVKVASVEQAESIKNNLNGSEFLGRSLRVDFASGKKENNVTEEDSVQ